MAAAKARVFFINRYFYPDESATSQLLSDLAFDLATGGYEVHVLCSRQLYGAPQARLPAQETLRGVFVHRLPTTRFGRHALLGRAIDYLSFYLSCAVSLLRLLKRHDIAVAKTDPPLISVVAAMSARLKGAVLINWLQDVFPEVATELGANPLPGPLDAGLRSIRNASLRSAAANVVLGQRMRQHLLELSVPPASIQIIENWAATEWPEPITTAHCQLRAQLGLTDKFVVQYSGNLGRAHEYETLLGAAEALRDDPTVAFLMIGGGAHMDALKLQADRRQLAHLRFLPYQPRERLGDSLAAADVHLVNLIPTLEGLIVPSKFYGILAAGRPVIFIGAADGELAQIIREARCGFAIAIGQSDDLVAAIQRLQTRADERSAFAAASLQLLRSRYTAAQAHARWRELLAAIRSACNDRDSRHSG